ncbi:hypothetical protein GPALN_003647 [Globodera pallida]|nr:hypothetical protein GPALN_003647 [Globodera pallida]
MKKKEERQHQNGTDGRKAEADGQELSDGKQQRSIASTSGTIKKRKKDATDEFEQTIERKQKSVPNGQVANLTPKLQKNKTKPVVTVAHQASNGINPLDTILNEIEAFDTANKKKIKKEIEIDNDEVDNAPCSSRQLPPTPMPGSYRSLNRTELARQDQDQSMVQSFLDRDDLMQRILAYKMLRGRVESYSTIRIKIDLDSCTIPEYELCPTEFDKNSSSDGKVAFVVKDEPVDMQLKLINPETPDQGGMKRGPMTPPGSPGTNRSSSSGAEAKLTETILPVECSSTMPKVKKEFEDIAPFDDSATKEMLRSFCTISGISTEMIRTFLGDDLQKLDKLKMEDLMKTFLESLKQVAGKKDKECSSKGMRSPVPSVVLPKDESKSIGSGRLSKAQAEDNFEADAMEISSQATCFSGSFSFSNGLLPPPPAPPPILDGTETDFMVPPPPPPPPMLENTASSLPCSSLNRLTSSPLSHPKVQSASDANQSSLHDASHAYVCPFKKFSKLSKPYERGGNRRGRLFPPTKGFPRSLRTARKSNIGGRVGRARQKMVPTQSTMNLQRPVSLLSLNLVEPCPETPQIELNKVVVDNTAFMGTSMSNSQQTNVPKAKVNSKSGKLPSSREVPPVVVDLEFIRNTPPPPIPDIIKRRISNDNKAAGMMSSAVPMVSHRAKRPPQSLLHMDLTRPPVFSRLHPPPPTFRQPNIVVHPSPPPVITTPNASTVLQTVVQAIGGNLRPPLLVQAQKAPTLPRPPLPNPASSPYGKFF